MAERQKRIWRTELEHAPKGILKTADARLLTAYALHVDVIIEAAKAQSRRPLVDGEGKSSPYLRLMRQHTEIMVRLASELGFTPVARARLGKPLAKAEDEVPADVWGRLQQPDEAKAA